MNKIGYIVICTVDREIYRLNDGNVFANPGDASNCMLADFKNELENNMPNYYESKQVMKDIVNFNYDDGECGIHFTSAYITTNTKNYDWSIINVYFDDAENFCEKEI